MESADPPTDERIRPLIQKYHNQKFLVAVYRSGTEDLFANTLVFRNTTERHRRSAKFGQNEQEEQDSGFV